MRSHCLFNFTYTLKEEHVVSLEFDTFSLYSIFYESFETKEVIIFTEFI